MLSFMHQYFLFASEISLTFDKYLGEDSNRLVGLCSICTGVGDMMASFILFTKNQSQIRGYFMSIVCWLAALAYLLPMLSLPSECTTVDSYKIGIITPSSTILMISAFCLGLLDGTVNSQLYSLIGSFISLHIQYTFRFDFSGRIDSKQRSCCFQHFRMQFLCAGSDLC